MTKISDLSAGGAFDSTDLIYVVETVGVGGVTKTGAQLADFIIATSPNLTVENPSDRVYLEGRETLDGSVRFIIDQPTGIAEVQARAAGVWNLGEFQLAQGSLLLGREVRVSAVGHHLVVGAPEEDHIVLAQDFTDEGTEPAESSAIGPLQTRVVTQSDNSGALTSAAHQSILSPPGLVISKTLYLQTGATAASSDVRVTLTEGVPPNDILFFKKNFAASKFPANSEVVIDLSPGVQFDPSVQTNIFVSSTSAFTLRYDVTNTLLWTAIDLQPLVHEDMMVEALILANDLRICFANNLDLPRPNPVFT